MGIAELSREDVLYCTALHSQTKPCGGFSLILSVSTNLMEWAGGDVDDSGCFAGFFSGREDGRDG